jgi:integrase/recombinase XerD
MNYEMTQTAEAGELMTAWNLSTLEQRFISFLDAKPKTIETYKRALHPFTKWTARRGIVRPQREDIIAFREELSRGGYSPSTIQLYIGTIKKFFAFLYTEGLYQNISENIKSAKVSRAFKKDYLTTEQVRNLLESIPPFSKSGARDYALVLLVVSCGLRTIEVSRANVEDIRTVSDFRALFVQGKGRDDKAEFVHLPPKTEKAIREYLKLRGATKGNEPLFASMSNNDKGGRMTTRAISGIIKTYLLKAGLNSSRLTAHSLRHTAATLARLAGNSLDEVQHFMRHKNITTTELYNHALNAAANKCSCAVEEAIGL